MLKKIIIVLLLKLKLDICKILIKSHRNRSRPKQGRLTGSMWGWVFSFFIGEPVTLFLMCTYMKFELYALLSTYATSSYINL